MIVTTSELLTLVSVKSFRKIEFIDEGETAVLKLIGLDSKDLAVVMPLQDALEMACSLIEASQSLAPKGQRPT